MNTYLKFESFFLTSKNLETKPHSVNSKFYPIVEIEVKMPNNFFS